MFVSRTVFGLLMAFLVALGATSSNALAQGDLLRDSLRDFRVADHWIYDDWPEAKRRAAAEKKPIFVVFRCVP